jgi:uncharacterized iron-regulated membrane protein
MSAKARLRHLHRVFSPWIVPSLLLMAVTGLIYRVGRAYFGMSKETGGKVLYLHSGAWLGENGSVIYLLIVGGALLFLVVSGLWMWFSSRSRVPGRKYHRLLSIIFAVPLALSAITGMAFQVGGKWLHASEPTMKLLLSLHQGSWLGPTLRPFYIMFLGLALIGLCLTGIRMLRRG